MTSRNHILFLAMFVAPAMLAKPAPLGAQPSSEAKAKANEILLRAYDAFDARRYADAAKYYLEFFMLVETEGLPLKADLLYNAAIVFEHLGECDRVAELLSRYIALEPKMKAGEVSRRLDDARACAPEVVIESDPRGAMVHIDGRARGVTPLTLHLRSGVHTLRLELSGHRAHEEPIAIETRKPVALRRLLHPEAQIARIALDVPAHAVAYLDELEIARGPYRGIREVAPGAHRLRVERAGCDSRELTIEAPIGGAPLAVEASPTCALERASGARVEAGRPGGVTDVTAPVHPRPVPGSETAGPSKWVWVVGGVGAAALIGGGVFTALAFSAERERDSASDLMTFRDAEDRRASFDTLQKVAFGTALIGLAVAGAIFALDLGAEGESPPERVEITGSAGEKDERTARRIAANRVGVVPSRGFALSW